MSASDENISTIVEAATNEKKLETLDERRKELDTLINQEKYVSSNTNGNDHLSYESNVDMIKRNEKNSLNPKLLTPSSMEQKKRKSLPKQSVTLLKQWLYEHRYKPYPSENEKVKLLEASKLSHVQMCNWFINARRRILPKIIRDDGGDPEDFINSHHATRRRRLLRILGEFSPLSVNTLSSNKVTPSESVMNDVETSSDSSISNGTSMDDLYQYQYRHREQRFHQDLTASSKRINIVEGEGGESTMESTSDRRSTSSGSPSDSSLAQVFKFEINKTSHQHVSCPSSKKVCSATTHVKLKVIKNEPSNTLVLKIIKPSEELSVNHKLGVLDNTFVASESLKSVCGNQSISTRISLSNSSHPPVKPSVTSTYFYGMHSPLDMLVEAAVKIQESELREQERLLQQK